MRSFCPPLDVSAYKLSFKTTLKSAEDLDTPEEQLAARQSMVDSLNEEASCACHRRGPSRWLPPPLLVLAGAAALRSARSCLGVDLAAAALRPRDLSLPLRCAHPRGF